MTKKRVLFFYTPSFYLVTGFKAKAHSHRFVGSGAKLLASSLDAEKFEVDLYDFDAKLMAHGPPIEEIITQIPELYYEELFVKYLTDSIPKNSLLESLIDLCIKDLDGYDFLLCGNPRNPMYEITNFAGNNLTLLIMQRLSDKNPGSERIYGGRRSNYFDFDDLSERGVDLNRFIDLVIYHEIPYQSINSLLLKNEVCGSGYKDFTGKYKPTPLPPRSAQPRLDYSKPRDIFRNQKDIQYSFRTIFSDHECDVPENADKNGYIQQAGFYFTGGCIANCAFCSTGVSPPRFNDITHVKDCIKMYVEELGYNAFFFKNATLNSNHAMVEDLCNWIVKENLKFYWSDSCRLSKNSDDFYPMLYEAGARMLCYGIDGGNDELLKYIRKGSSAEEMERQLTNAHKAGIWNLANFILGLPYETESDMDDTVDFLKRNLHKINIFKMNVFHIEQVSPFALQPHRFDISLRLDPQNGRELENVIYEEIPYDETKGRTWEEILEYRDIVRDKIRYINDNFRNDSFKTHIGQHLLFALYDIFENKADVESWLQKNYNKGKKRYYQKYENHEKIEPWTSDFNLFPNFEDKTSEKFIFRGHRLSTGHAKLNTNT